MGACPNCASTDVLTLYDDEGKPKIYQCRKCSEVWNVRTEVTPRDLADADAVRSFLDFMADTWPDLPPDEGVDYNKKMTLLEAIQVLRESYAGWQSWRFGREG